MSPTAPVTWLHNDILNNHTFTLLGLHFGGKMLNNHTLSLSLSLSLSHTHTHTQWPAAPLLQHGATDQSLALFSVPPVSQSDTWRRTGNCSGEESQRLRKNGIVNGGIQQREGISTGVFRQMARRTTALSLWPFCVYLPPTANLLSLQTLGTVIMLVTS